MRKAMLQNIFSFSPIQTIENVYLISECEEIGGRKTKYASKQTPKPSSYYLMFELPFNRLYVI
jgi:hypothetical protein